jgi:hypothetical protein
LEEVEGVQVQFQLQVRQDQIQFLVPLHPQGVEQEKPVIQHPQQLMEDQEVAVVVQEQLLIQEEQEILLQYLQHKVLLEEMVQDLQAQVVEAVEELQP